MNIKELAKICGVSASTVSKAFHKDSTISETTRCKIMDMAKKYNYIPYSEVLKEAVPNLNLIAIAHDKDNSYERNLVYELEEKLFGKGYNSVLFNISGDSIENERYLKSFESKGISGYIFLHEYDGECPECPAVFLTQNSSLRSNETAASVCINNANIEVKAIEYLYNKGHKNIAYFSDGNSTESFSKYENGYKKILGSLPKKEWEICGNQELIYDSILRCISNEITAIICADSNIADNIYIQLLKMGISVPDKMSIMVLHNPELQANFPVAFSSINVPNEYISDAITHSITDLIETEKKGYDISISLEPEIVDRGSISAIDIENPNEKIIVIGNINMDYNLFVRNIPMPGETVNIENCMVIPGGKGGNQAVGIAKTGGYVNLIACLGDDQDGHAIYATLQDSGVRMEGVSFHKSQPTGKAYITFEESERRTVTLLNGANTYLDINYIRENEYLFGNAKYCIISTGLNEAMVAYVIKMCFHNNIKVIVKPSFIDTLSPELYPLIDYFIPNQEEAMILMPGAKNVEDCAKKFWEYGVKNVIITLGNQGCYLLNNEISEYFSAENFPAIDVTGASDAFISIFAEMLCKAQNIRMAIKVANYAAGVSITTYGVQSSMIDKNGLDVYLNNMKDKRIG